GVRALPFRVAAIERKRSDEYRPPAEFFASLFFLRIVKLVEQKEEVPAVLVRLAVVTLSLILVIGAGADTPAPRPLESHWAFQPGPPRGVPAGRDQTWVRTPTAAFTRSRLEAKGLPPAPSAAPRPLLRRVYLDLIGLPPTPAEQEAFLSDSSADALAK